MGLMQRMMALETIKKDYIKDALLIWLDGYDAPVNGKWVSRIGNYTGTISNSSYLTTERAYNFNGINSQILTNFTPTSQSPYTIEVGFIDPYNASGEYSGTGFFLSTTNDPIAFNGVNGIIRSSGIELAQRTTTISATLIPKANYQNMRFATISYTANSSFQLTNYLNSTLFMQSTQTGLPQTYPLTLGTSPGMVGYHGLCKLCFVRWYNRALTQQEINQNYTIDKMRFNL